MSLARVETFHEDVADFLLNHFYIAVKADDIAVAAAFQAYVTAIDGED